MCFVLTSCLIIQFVQKTLNYSVYVYNNRGDPEEGQIPFQGTVFWQSSLLERHIYLENTKVKSALGILICSIISWRTFQKCSVAVTMRLMECSLCICLTLSILPPCSQIIVPFILISYKKMWCTKSTKRQCQIIKIDSPVARTAVSVDYHSLICKAGQWNSNLPHTTLTHQPSPRHRSYSHNPWYMVQFHGKNIQFKSCMKKHIYFDFLSHFYSTFGRQFPVL